jgi:DNA polymerase III sliding clamp (beta) subunit (PCNA family)
MWWMKTSYLSLTSLRKGGIYLKCTIDRMELLTAVKRAASIAPTASPLNILKCVLLDVHPEQKSVRITATNLEITLEQTLPLLAVDGSDIALAVNAQLADAMLSRLAGDTVELELSDTGRARITSGDASYVVPTLPGTEYPRVEIPFPADTVKVSGLPTMVQRTAFATTENKAMPLLKCLDLRFTRDGLTAVGSDGQCIVSAKGDKQCIGDIQFLVPAASLEKLARMCCDKDTFSVGTTGKQLIFLKDRLVYSARLMDGSYINTDQILGNLKNIFSVLSDASELRRALGSASTVSTDNRVKLDFAGDTLRMECLGEIGTASASVNTVPLVGTPAGSYCYAADRLERCLRSLGGTMTLGIAQGGLLTLTTEDAFYMQTAMRMTEKKKPKQTQQVPEAA